MNFIKILAVSLFSLLMCSCGSSSDSTGSKSAPEIKSISKSITYNDVTPGNASPETFYQEAITISGTTMTVTRNGGARVNSGTWTINLKQVEVTEIDKLLSLADEPAVRDYISNEIVYDGPNSILMIGDSKTFRYGMDIDPVSNTNQWHQFPVEAANLVNYIDSVMVTYAGNRYK